MALWSILSSPDRSPLQASTPHAAYQTDQLVIKLAEGQTVAAINATYGTTTLRELLNFAGIYLLQIPAGGDAESLAASMHSDPRLLYAELNVTNAAPEANSQDTYAWPENSASTTTSTTSTTQINPRLLYEWQWSGFDTAHYFQQTAVDTLKLSDAQQISLGAGVIVAVLDTGVDLNHPVLVNSLTAVRYDFIENDDVPQDSANGLDDDGDGAIDEVFGHGTHVAGIVHLIAPSAQIMPLRVLDSDGQGNSFVIAEAMLYAAHNGAKVINLSLSTPVQSQFLQDVVNTLAQQGVVVVAAAGNMNQDLAQYPAAYPCVLAVTASKSGTKQKASYANYGAWVDLVAPGGRIYSTYPNGGFAWWKGTSMATPLVSGQVALLLSKSPTLSLSQIGQIVAGTAVSLDTTNPDYTHLLGSGRINIGDSLQSLQSGNWPTPSLNPLQGCGS